MLREAELDLDLLAAGDAAMQTPAIVENAMHHRVVLRRYRPGELAPDHVVRQIGGQPQVGEAVQQVQREEQVGGHAVAMGLDMHGYAGLRRQAAPALDVGDAVGQTIRPHVGLQVDVVGAEFPHQRQNRLQFIDSLRG